MPKLRQTIERPCRHAESDAEVRCVSQEGADTPVGEHFVLKEFQCHDGTDILKLHPALIYHLNKLRKHFGSACRVNSGFRTHAYNKQIGGADNSRHLYGMAADVDVRGTSPDEVADWAEEYGFGGVGRYYRFTHVDVWSKGRRWDRRN